MHDSASSSIRVEYLLSTKTGFSFVAMDYTLSKINSVVYILQFDKHAKKRIFHKYYLRIIFFFALFPITNRGGGTVG